MNLWISLAKLKIDVAVFDKTIYLLTRLPTISRVFKLKELEPSEVISIIVVMSSLKIKNKSFLEELTNHLSKDFSRLNKNDLINLARVFIVYVRLFEDFY